MSVSGSSSDEQISPSTPVGGAQQEPGRSEVGEEPEQLNGEDADELNEKRRLIRDILEMQATLEALSGRVDSVREENLRLRSENQVLGQYIENLMQASQVFQAIPPSKAAASSAVAGRPTFPQNQQSVNIRSGNVRSNAGSGSSTVGSRGIRGAQNGSK